MPNHRTGSGLSGRDGDLRRRNASVMTGDAAGTAAGEPDSAPRRLPQPTRARPHRSEPAERVPGVMARVLADWPSLPKPRCSSSRPAHRCRRIGSTPRTMTGPIRALLGGEPATGPVPNSRRRRGRASRSRRRQRYRGARRIRTMPTAAGPDRNVARRVPVRCRDRGAPSPRHRHRSNAHRSHGGPRHRCGRPHDRPGSGRRPGGGPPIRPLLWLPRSTGRHPAPGTTGPAPTTPQRSSPPMRSGDNIRPHRALWRPAVDRPDADRMSRSTGRSARSPGGSGAGPPDCGTSVAVKATGGRIRPPEPDG